MNKIIIYFFSLLLFSTVNASTIDSLFYTNPEYHIAQDLFNKKIIMLGDCAHHQPESYQQVYKTLYNWLEICKSKNQEIKLTLIIEEDSETIENINEYILKGNFLKFINKITPNFYLEDLEYYTELRNFSESLDSINRTRINKISFKIKGFEESLRKLYQLSNREWELWFINKRDSLVSNGIINYIRNNPTEQILMFYGTAHFIDTYVNKNFGFKDLTNKESMGFYLGHFLKQAFGKGNIFSYYTLIYSDSLIKNKSLDLIKDQDFITKQENLYFPGNSGWDLILVCHGTLVPNIDANLICSKIIIEKSIKEIQKIKSFLPSEKAKYFYNSYIYKIFFLTGKIFKNDSLIKWEDFDETNWLYSDSLKDAIISFLSRYKNSKEIFNNEYCYLLRNYGFICKNVDTSIELES